MKDILDLRFIIGLFFLLVGILLFIESFVSNPVTGKTETVNLWSGVAYIVFGIFMLILWMIGRGKIADADSN